VPQQAGGHRERARRASSAIVAISTRVGNGDSRGIAHSCNEPFVSSQATRDGPYVPDSTMATPGARPCR
jgi:hypothetical protein